ncbi:hypothetical protein LFML04_2114 [Leptospirillum ferriphilum ML-04]|uniref:Uncharacterized protein n=1 Tax=Leptospirillum ferriphilum (strain ML-04) TaxID=1048260 RepID=J9ZCK1_LEPFM|nr:hypothetical protein LFML04_2114 [Leptospirillum ferriphilum ML-04]
MWVRPRITLAKASPPEHLCHLPANSPPRCLQPVGLIECGRPEHTRSPAPRRANSSP